jgi:hypothetical protein
MWRARLSLRGCGHRHRLGDAAIAAPPGTTGARIHMGEDHQEGGIMAEIFRSMPRPVVATLAVVTAVITATLLYAKSSEAVPARCDEFDKNGRPNNGPFIPSTPLPYSGCAPGEFCVYDEKDGCGRHLHMTVAKPIKNFASRRAEGGALNDKVSSVFNNSNVDWCLFEHADTRKHRGETLRIRPGEKRTITGDRGSNDRSFRWNDKASGANPC